MLHNIKTKAKQCSDFCFVIFYLLYYNFFFFTFHPNSLLKNFSINDGTELWKKAEATVRVSFGEEVHFMNPDLTQNLVACLIGAPYLDSSIRQAMR